MTCCILHNICISQEDDTVIERVENPESDYFEYDEEVRVPAGELLRDMITEHIAKM